MVKRVVDIRQLMWTAVARASSVAWHRKLIANMTKRLGALAPSLRGARMVLDALRRRALAYSQAVAPGKHEHVACAVICFTSRPYLPVGKVSGVLFPLCSCQ